MKEPHDLAALALNCRALASHDSDFDEAFWHCVERLADDTSDNGVETLNLLMQEVNAESGDKQLFEEAVAYQQEKRRREGKD